jgi:hypothetical protein
MPLSTAYLTTTRNLEGILTAVKTAQAPQRFSTRFLETIGYKSAADRLIIGLLKALGFLDDASAPTDRYFRFLDQSESGRVLAEGIREAYDDLFRINIKANELPEADVKGKLRTLTQGQKSDTVLDDMAKTFIALCQIADWTVPEPQIVETQVTTQNKPEEDAKTSQVLPPQKSVSLGQLSYNIQIILPATRDAAVYDALFKSLKEHLIQ